MNKQDLAAVITREAGLSKQAGMDVLDAVLNAIAGAVAKGDKVSLSGFGTFEKAERGERNGRNPHTGAAITVEATTVPKFRAGATFKARVKTGR